MQQEGAGLSLRPEDVVQKNKEDKVGVNRSGCPGHKQASDDTCPPHFI